MVEVWGWVDPHTHMDTRPYEDFEAMGIAGIRDIITLAHDPLRMCHACVLLDHFYRLTTFEVKRGEENGVRVHVALGIHPRAIPEEVEVVIKALPRLLLHPSAVAIGEVGLEAGSEKEVEVFRGMLGIVGEYPGIVHTPRNNKEEITERIIGIVEEMGVKADKILIDHVNIATIGDVLSSGAYAGLTVQPGKLSIGDLAAILEDLGGDELARVVVNSDLSSLPSDPLAVARTAHYLLKIGVDVDIVKKVCGENARRLFGLKG